MTGINSEYNFQSPSPFYMDVNFKSHNSFVAPTENLQEVSQVSKEELTQLFPDLIDYKFNERELIKEIQSYIDKTYGQHYTQNKIQTTEFIMDCGQGHGFCAGNAIKYIQRYGKKAGYNRDDLMKVVHYAILMLFWHDNYAPKKETNERN